MVDDKLKPWLLEINYTPSFTCDTPLDKLIKKGVVTEAIEIVNLSHKQKEKYIKSERNRIKNLGT